jgi:peroxiredoxin
MAARSQQGLPKGDKAPDFAGRDQYKKAVKLSEVLKKGKAVLIFYRGNWCPNCSRALSNIQDSLSLLTAEKVTVIGIGPESAEGLAKTIKKTRAAFSVIRDKGLVIMKAYKIAFDVTRDMEEVHQKYHINVAGNNGPNGNRLPRPSTFIIGQDGTIVYSYVNNSPYSDPASNNRMTVREILEKAK